MRSSNWEEVPSLFATTMNALISTTMFKIGYISKKYLAVVDSDIFTAQFLLTHHAGWETDSISTVLGEPPDNFGSNHQHDSRARQNGNRDTILSNAVLAALKAVSCVQLKRVKSRWGMMPLRLPCGRNHLLLSNPFSRKALGQEKKIPPERNRRNRCLQNTRLKIRNV